MKFITSIFGKNPITSLTAWGLGLWVGVDAGLGQLCEAGVLEAGLCGTLQSWSVGLGQILTFLGLRRRLN